MGGESACGAGVRFARRSEERRGDLANLRRGSVFGAEEFVPTDCTDFHREKHFFLYQCRSVQSVGKQNYFLYWLLVTGYWLLVTGYWSLVTGHWSLVTNNG
ncbi:hypothetical protein CR161_02780 [Prosthecochloris sp. ZM]|nr:hypothetical protein CR161_02780 [Prosthecochloris sp. ZM]